MSDRTYSEDEVECALCVWEYLTDTRYEERSVEPYDKLFNDLGTGEMRRIVWQDCAPQIESWYQQWRAVQSDPDALDAFAYDWEIVPLLTDIWFAHRGKAPEAVAVTAFAKLDALAKEDPNNG